MDANGNIIPPRMDQTITIDVIGEFLVAITQGDSLVSTKISEGALLIKTADIEMDSQTLPVMIPPAAHMGKLEILDNNEGGWTIDLFTEIPASNTSQCCPWFQ